jgi:hypothetical protein
MTEPDLFKAISHCKEVISKLDNCPCKDDHKELLYFLEELQFRRELDVELPWEVSEIISRFRYEYDMKEKRKEITKYDFDAFDLLHDEHREFSPKQIFALKCFGITFVITLIFFLGLIVML